MPEGYPGGTLVLEQRFYDGALQLVDPTSPTVDVVDPQATVVVAGAALTRLATGIYSYAFAIPADAEPGTWAQRPSGVVDGVLSTGEEPFEVLAVGDVVDVAGEVTVVEELLDPAGGRRQPATVTLSLVGSDTGERGVTDPSTLVTLLGRAGERAERGLWVRQLRPNAELSPENNYYRRHAQVGVQDGASVAFTVPQDPPTTALSSPLTIPEEGSFSVAAPSGAFTSAYASAAKLIVVGDAIVAYTGRTPTAFTGCTVRRRGAGSFAAGTTVQQAYWVAELEIDPPTGLPALHSNQPVGAHAASAVSVATVVGVGGPIGSDVQTALANLATTDLAEQAARVALDLAVAHLASPAEVTAVWRILAEFRLGGPRPFCDPFAYGAVADGTTHKISEIFGTNLSAAQAYYGSWITDLNRERDWAALRKAKEVAQAVRGVVVVPGTNNGYYCGDGPGDGTYGLNLNTQQCAIVGYGMPKLIWTGTLVGCVVITAGRCMVSNLWCVTGTGHTVGIGVTTTGSTQNTCVTNCMVDGGGPSTAALYAYGAGWDTTGDVSEAAFIGCSSVWAGYTQATSSTVVAAHVVFGNGGTGNVLDIYVLGGNASHPANVAIFNGGAGVCRGIGAQWSRWGDYWYRQAPSGAVFAGDCRSEHALRLIRSTGTTFVHPVAFENISGKALENTDGLAVDWISLTPLGLRNVVALGTGSSAGTAYGGIPQHYNIPGTGQPYLLADVVRCGCDADNPFGSRRHSLNVRRFAQNMIRYGSGGQPTLFTMEPSREQERLVEITVSAANQALTIDARKADIYELYLTANLTSLTIVGGNWGRRLRVRFVQDGTGGRTYAYPGDVAWDSGGAAPANTTTARRSQLLDLQYDGRNWVAATVRSDIAPATVAAADVTATFPTAQIGSFGSADTGQPWLHLVGNGSIAGGKAYPLTFAEYAPDINPGKKVFLAAVESGRSSFTMQGTWTYVSTATGWQGLAFCIRDDQNFYFLQMIDTQVRVNQVIRGQVTWTGLAWTVSHTGGQEYVVKLVRAGSLLTYFEGGSQVGSQLNLGAGSAGELELGTYTRHGVFCDSAMLGCAVRQFTVAA